MFLTLDKFLQHFPPVKISRAQFIKKMKIMYGKQLTLENAFDHKPIRIKHKGQWIQRPPVIKSNDDYRIVNRDELIDYLYQIVITHRHYYLKKHFEAYLCFPNPYKLKWSSKVDLNLPKKMGFVENDSKYAGNLSLQKNDGSRRIVRNLFYLELLHLTQVTNTVKSNVSYWQALDNLYNKLELEDRLFAPSSVKLFLRPKKTKKEYDDIPNPPKSFKGFNSRLNWHNLFYLLQAYQPKASIINPYFIHWCLENIFVNKSRRNQGGKKILTPVLSWGSYLIAFMHTSGWDHYVGIDVMPSICEKVNFLAEYYHDLPETESEKKVELYCQPSELLAKDPSFMKKYRNYFDLVLICPPYYDMEIYHEGQQSIDLYPSYEEWLEKYWYQTCKMAYHTCQKGGTYAVIMNDYFTLTGDYYPLTKDLTKYAIKAGFKYDRFYYLFNRTSPLRVNKKERTERLAIFKKS